MMFLDAISYLPDDILVKVDRAGMSVSLETRVPLLDHRVVEFAWRVPTALKHRDGQGKWLLRQVLYKYVPKPLVERPKMGFGVPIDSWLRGPLARVGGSAAFRITFESAKATSSQRSSDRSGRRISTGKIDQHPLLWNVLMFQSWLETTQTRDCASNAGGRVR